MPKRFIPNDAWSRKAKSEGFRARSVYKLQELDEKFRLIGSNMTVLDLGAAPGSWLQFVSSKCSGRIIGVDLQEIEPIDGVELHVADITDANAIGSIIGSESEQSIDLILSDLAPKTSGISDVDQWKSIELSQAVMDVARAHLKPKGTVVMKILRGADFDSFLKELKQECREVKTYIPKACRDRSKEVYVIARK